MCAYISFISRNLQWAFCQLNLLYSLPVPLLKYLIPNTTFLSHFQGENNESDSLCLSSPRMTITYSCDWHILTQGENNVYFPLTLFSPRVRITTAINLSRAAFKSKLAYNLGYYDYLWVATKSTLCLHSVNVSPSTLARLVSRWAMPAGSCIAWSMASR